MLQAVHERSNICKVHILKFDDGIHGDSLPSTTWCNSNIQALKTDLDMEGIAPIPLGDGMFLIYPQTRDVVQAIATRYSGQVFDVKDKTPPFPGLNVQEDWHGLVRRALYLYGATRKEWYPWMDKLDKQLQPLVVPKSHLDAPSSGSFIWVEWNLDALRIADTSKRTNLEDFILKDGLLDDVYLIQPLKYDLCEILVNADREKQIEMLFTGKKYADFDKKSPLVSHCGYKESVRTVLASYKNNTRTWASQDALAENRTKQLEAILKLYEDELEALGKANI